MNVLGYVVGLLLAIAGVILLFMRFKNCQTEITLTHFGAIKTTNPGLALAFLGVFLCVLSLLSAIRSNEQQNAIRDLNRDLSRSQLLIISFLDPSLLRNPTFRNYFAAIPPTQQEPIVRKANDLLRPAFQKVTDLKQSNFTQDDFAEVLAICEFLVGANVTDGSALYYKGEVQRLLRRRFLMRESFSLYVSHAPKAGETISGIRALGYFDERTAWIHHLLANDFLCEAQQQTALSARLDSLRAVVEHVEAERKYWKKPFRAGETTLSTADLGRVVANEYNPIINHKCPSMS